MPTLTEARYEALRRAREAARVVLAKHTCVTGGGRCGEAQLGPVDPWAEGDRGRSRHEGENIPGGQQVGAVGAS